MSPAHKSRHVWHDVTISEDSMLGAFPALSYLILSTMAIRDIHLHFIDNKTEPEEVNDSPIAIHLASATRGNLFCLIPNPGSH